MNIIVDIATQVDLGKVNDASLFIMRRKVDLRIFLERINLSFGRCDSCSR